MLFKLSHHIELLLFDSLHLSFEDVVAKKIERRSHRRRDHVKNEVAYVCGRQSQLEKIVERGRMRARMGSMELEGKSEKHEIMIF
ncbi:hypothetical protein Csa_011951 [Cucumis sativus]|uniref:Uncharacterized protein n=1 Tax=Cucumis sativus TaxID=3659 RepID=A0A0A0KZY6_CUCSA|nr:hypothetical protein Csa_011951 [Cucumis sativus]